MASPTQIASHPVIGPFSEISRVGGEAGRTDEGILVAFRDLTYAITKDGKDFQILKGVSAFFQPGRMVAIMGPSGSGKSTLLDVLSGRKTSGKLGGLLLFGDKRSTPAYLKRRTAYVEQFDTLVDVLTVREQLLYQAELKRPGSEPAAERVAFVDTLISELGLSGVKNSVIGNPLSRGISGGQAKRVNIGLALVAQPDVLFLDEPTSGLDSATSDDIMGHIKTIVTAMGITVCSTIHSPSETTFALFDDLLLLVGGRTCYFGAIAESTADPRVPHDVNQPGLSHAGTMGSHMPHVIVGEVMRYFTGLGCAYTSDYALADWVVKITQPVPEETVADANLAATGMGPPRGAPPLDFASAYERSDLNKSLTVALDRMLPHESAEDAPIHDELPEAATSVARGLWVLLKYRTVNQLLDPMYWIARSADKLIIGFVVFSLYLLVAPKSDATSINNIVGFLFMNVMSPGFGAVTFVPSIILLRSLFNRERNDGCYLAVTYCAWKLLEEFFMCAFTAIIWTGTVYYSIGFQGGFGNFYLTYFLLQYCSVCVAYTVAALSPVMEVAIFGLPAYMSFQAFFIGSFIIEPKIPNYWAWAKYLCYMRYGWRAFMIDNFGSQSLNDPILFQGGPGNPGISTLTYYSLTGEDKYHDLGWITIFIAFFIMTMYGSMSYVNWSKR